MPDDPTTLTVRGPQVGDVGFLTDGVDCPRERMRITAIGMDPDGTPTMDIELWDEPTQSYTLHRGVRWGSDAR